MTASGSELYRCKTCGAPRDPRRPACAYCGAEDTLDARERAARRRARLVLRGAGVERRLLASGRALGDRVLSLGRRHRRRWGVLVAVCVPGLLLTLWLVAQAPAEDALAVLVLFGGATFASGSLLAGHFAAAPEPELEPAPFLRCSSCGWRHDVHSLFGLCALCLAGARGDLPAPDLESWRGPTDADGAEAGACERCGGAVVLRDGLARCAHCGAPLHPSPAAAASLTARLDERREQHRLLRHFISQRERALGASFDRLFSWLPYALGAGAVILWLLSVLHRWRLL